MKETITLLSFAASVAVLGCSSDGGGAASSASATAAATTAAPPVVTTSAATATASGPPLKPLSSNAIPLKTLGLAYEPPADVKATVNEIQKDATIIHFKGHEVSITLGHAHGDMKHLREKRAKDEGFVRWVTETDETSVAEIEVNKVKEYYGFTLKKFGEQVYECGTLTMKRRSFNNEKAVRSSLAFCDGLRPN